MSGVEKQGVGESELCRKPTGQHNMLTCLGRVAVEELGVAEHDRLHMLRLMFHAQRC